MAYDIGPRIGIDGEKEFKSALAAINSQMKNFQSEMKAAVTSMDGMQSAEEATAKKTDILSRAIEAGKQKVALIQGEYDRAKERLEQLGKELDDTKKEFGENSEEALKAEQAYNKQAKAVNDLGTKLNNAQADVNKMTHELDTLGDEADDAGDELEDAGKKSSTFGDTLKGVVTGGIIVKGLEAIANAAKRVGREMVEAVKGAVTYADDLMTLSAQTGIATDKLQEYQYMSELVDVSVDTLTGSMAKLTKNMGSAQGGTGKAADAFKTLGVSVTDSSGNLRDNEDVFADVVDALGQMTNETERDTLAMAIFGKSAQELNPLIKAGGDEIQRLAEEAHRMGYVLDDEALAALVAASDAFARMHNVATMLKNQLAVALAPVIEKLAGVLTDLIQRVDWDAFAEKIGNFLNFVIDHGKACAVGLGLIAAGFVAVSAAASPLVLVAAALAAIAIEVIKVKKALDDMLNVDVPGWAAAVLSAIGSGPIKAMSLLDNALKTDEENANKWRDTHFKASQDVAQASIETSAAMGEAFINAGDKIKSAFADIKYTGKEMRDSLSETAQILSNDFQNMVANVKTAFGNLKDNVSQIVSNIVDKIKALPAQMLQIGADMVSGLWQGIKTRAQWLLDQIKAWANGIVQGIKNTFKIASPSKVMRDEVGKQITAGMALGIKTGTPAVKKAMQGTGITVLQIADGILSKLEAKEEEMTRLINSSGTDEVAKSVLKTQQEQLKQYVSDFSKAIDEIRKKQDSLTTKLRGYGNLMQTITSDASGSSLGAWGGAVGMQNEIDRLEKYSDLLEQIKALNLGDDFMADFLATDIDDAIDYAEKLLMLPDKMREEYLALWDQQKALAASVDEARKREKTEETILSDLGKQTESIKEYGDLLEELKNAGAPESLLSEVTSMGVDDATVYMKKLLGLTDDGLDEYISLWNEKQETAARISERFYKQEGEAIVAEFAEKLPDELKDMQDDFFQVGQDAGKGLADGILSMVGTVTAAAKKIAQSARDAIQTQEEIHSPSQKWADLGGYMAAGVAQGFNRTMASISGGIMSSVQTVRTSDLERVGSGIVNGMAVSGTGGYGGRIEVPLVINGREFARAVLTDFRAVQKASPEVAYG